MSFSSSGTWMMCLPVIGSANILISPAGAVVTLTSDGVSTRPSVRGVRSDAADRGAVAPGVAEGEVGCDRTGERAGVGCGALTADGADGAALSGDAAAGAAGAGVGGVGAGVAGGVAGCVAGTGAGVAGGGAGCVVGAGAGAAGAGVGGSCSVQTIAKASTDAVKWSANTHGLFPHTGQTTGPTAPCGLFAWTV
jgi:hypothetical protein